MLERDDALERLEKKFESSGEVRGVRRSVIPERSSRAPRIWKSSPTQPPRLRSRFGVAEVTFGAAFIFFLIAAGIAALLFFSGENTISTKNIDVLLSGPSEIEAGNTLSLQIVVTNRNTVPMELTDLVVEFPLGTRSDADITTELPRIRESLGTIDPGESVNRTVRAVIFGREGSSVSVKASVEYRIPASNAIFVSEGSYVAKINQAPASITIEALKETVSGQEVSMMVTIQSNAPDVLTDMLLIAEYPPGFSFIGSTPVPATGTGAFALGDIEPGGRRLVTIRGIFTGEDGDMRVMHFSTGMRKQNRNDEIIAPLTVAEVNVLVTKPFVSIALALDGDVSAEHVISRGKEVRGDIRWVNNLPVEVSDIEIELSIKGSVLDRTRVKAQNGFFRSSDQTIIWSRETDPKLRNVAPGASGVSSFAFMAFWPSQITPRNPELNFSVTVRARRISESNVPEVIQSSAASRAVVATELVLSPLLSHGSLFADAGPLPPKADVETEYTVTWTVSNSSNAVANALVTAALPSYTRWTGAVSPAGVNISYNPVGGIVTWTIGDIAENQAKTAAFQIAITPSLSQVETAPIVVSDQRVYGFDRFAQTPLQGTATSLTTASASADKGRVVP